VSNSDNAARPEGSFASETRRALAECMAADPSVVLGGQLIRYGYAGITTGLYEKYPERFITYSVSEDLMNGSAMGLALAGKRVCMFHVRLDFLLCGCNALFNHIPIWWKKGHKLPITIIAQHGRGVNSGQGAQHCKDLTFWFQHCEGWRVQVPQTPQEAYWMLRTTIEQDKPTLYVIHRWLWDQPAGTKIETPQEIKLCGASKRHMEAFYGD
jgi:pyruvate/2-oxoglutarate/acetoin dehydrogenase E1 component